MIWHDHSKLVGEHAFLGASKYHWLNYTDDQMIAKYKSSYTQAVGTYLHELAAGLIENHMKLSKSDSRKEDFGKYISSVCDEMITAMSNRYDDFANAGSYVIAGFVKGMKDAKMDAITAASNIALEAYRAACDTLDVHSPSKKFAWIGMQTDKGLAEGMLKYGRVAKEAAKRIASETVNAAQNSIYGIRGMFDGIDLTPIIRPIVDLDAVKNGVAQLNGMTTGMNTGLRLDTAYAYVSSAAASMDAKKANENQNGLEKVVNELKALRDNPPVTMNNKFDITNPDPEAVANKAVSKIVRQIGRDTSRG